jgi:superfamily II DNA or RNA helicase
MVDLRYYQARAVNAIMESLKEHRSCLCVMATGTGKTVTASAIAKDWPGNVLWLAHRQELVLQARDELERMTGEYVGMEQGDTTTAGTERIVVGSIQTVQKQKRLERFPKDRFSLLILDESAHAPARTFRRPLDYFSSAKLVGITAYPGRMDGKALGQIFEDVPDACMYDVYEAIEDGYLVPFDCHEVTIEKIDISWVDTSKGDLVISQLDEAMIRAVEGICSETLSRCDNRQGIVFLPGVRSAEYCAARFNALRPGSAFMVSAKTDPDDRRQMFEAFRNGGYQFLCNVQIATEGTDLPSVGAVIQGRPTLSLSLYGQMLGRGTRPLPGVVDPYNMPTMAQMRRHAIAQSEKKNCLVLDLVGNHGKHDLMSPVNILGGDYTPAEIKQAKKILKEKKSESYSPKEVLELARKELEERALAIQASVKANSKKFDPFQIIGVSRYSVDRYEMRFGRQPPTRPQLESLRKMGLRDDDLRGVSKREATKLLAERDRLRKMGLRSFAQAKLLAKWGITGKSIRFTDASSAIDYLARTGWGKQQKVDPLHLERLVRSRRQPGQEG